MTIKQFAAERGITVQAVYQKLKKNGLDVDKFINHENPYGKSELSEEGLNVLTSLFKNKPASKLNPLKVEKRIEELEADIKRLTDEKTALEADNAKIKQELTEAIQREASARNTAEHLTETLAAITATQDKTIDALTSAQRIADQAQQLHAMQLKALPGGGVKGWFSKLFNRKGDAE